MKSAVHTVERLLFVAGLMILGYCGADWLNSRIQQHKGNQELDRILSEQSRAKKAQPGSVQPAKPALREGSLVGKVEIPKLRLSAVVFQGTNNEVLDRGVGHLDESALPGQPGNVVLAAHRDTFFRSLRNVQKGDAVRVTTPYGVRTYTVDSMQIVAPTQTSVMDPTPEPTLTLITCYPFNFVGHAPKRFIVRAHDASRDASTEEASKPTGNQKEGQVAQVVTHEPREKLTYVFSASVDNADPAKPEPGR
jgi:sortase A